MGALVLALPLVFGTGWYAWSAYARFDRYRRAAREKQVKLDPELFQIFLHDELARDLRRLRLPDPPQNSALELLEIAMNPGDLEALERESNKKGKRSSKKAAVRMNGEIRKAEIRRQGRRHWHAVGSQKSLKIRLEPGELLGGARVFNLLNDVTPFGLEEETILDLARERGLLAPEYRAVRVRIANLDMGVYRFEPQPDEGLLRRQGRMPGSMYSGAFVATCETPPPEGVPCGWAKIASRAEEEKGSFAELEGLLTALSSSHAALDRYAADRLDLERFALFDALDVVFGGEQHDAESNHKIYYDFYRGRFEPVARDFRAFTHDPVMNLAESPLQLRLKALPDYRWRRDRWVYALITHEASVPAIRARIDAQMTTLRPELESDPHWDAFKLLPRASRFHRHMLRPINSEQWHLAAQSEVATYARRTRFLLDRLEGDDLQIAGRPAGGGFVFEIRVSGHGAEHLRRLTVVGGSRFRVNADRDLDGHFDPSRDPELAAGRTDASVELSGHDRLLAGVKLVANADGKPMTEPDPRTYRYFVRWTGKRPDGVWIDLTSLVTGASARHYLPIGEATGAPLLVDAALPSADAVPALVLGETSPHPWSLEGDPAQKEVSFGPGRVVFEADRHFSKGTHVTFAPGTDVRLGPSVSLLFEGRLTASGEIDAPIRFEPAREESGFGGIVIAGPGAAGTRLRHVRIRGGTKADVQHIYAPNVLSIYDTRDIALEEVRINGASATEDVLHATYVDGLVLDQVVVDAAKSDALDLEHTKATLRGVWVTSAGDECLDLMATEVTISDSLLIGCGGNAISAGEGSRVSLYASVLARAKVGVLAKNASQVRISHVVAYDAKQALRTNRRDMYYSEPSAIEAQDLHAIDCGRVKRRAAGTRIEIQNLHGAFPTSDRWRRSMRQLLGIRAWSELDARLTELARGDRL